MTNYNDGRWHGWNGGECPVHPKTLVDVVYLVEGVVIRATEAFANCCDWGSKNPVIAFRVVKEYREPREWWIAFDSAYPTPEGAREYLEACGYTDEIIHVREVLD